MAVDTNTPQGWDKVEGGARSDQEWKKTDAERGASQQGQLNSRIDQKIKQVADRMRGADREHSPMAQKLRQLAEHFNGGRAREGRGR